MFTHAGTYKLNRLLEKQREIDRQLKEARVASVSIYCAPAQQANALHAITRLENERRELRKEIEKY